jgi:hypothetical protein
MKSQRKMKVTTVKASPEEMEAKGSLVNISHVRGTFSSRSRVKKLPQVSKQAEEKNSSPLVASEQQKEAGVLSSPLVEQIKSIPEQKKEISQSLPKAEQEESQAPAEQKLLSISIPKNSGLDVVSHDGLMRDYNSSLSKDYQLAFSSFQEIAKESPIIDNIQKQKYAKLKIGNISEDKEFIFDPNDKLEVLEKAGKAVISRLLESKIAPDSIKKQGKCLSLVSFSNTKTIYAALSGSALGSVTRKREDNANQFYKSLEEACMACEAVLEGGRIEMMQQISEDFKRLLNRIAIEIFGRKELDFNQTCAEHSYVAHSSKLFLNAALNLSQSDLKDISINHIINVGLSSVEGPYKAGELQINDKLTLPLWRACDNCQHFKEIYLFTMAAMQWIREEQAKIGQITPVSPIGRSHLRRSIMTLFTPLCTGLADENTPIGKLIFDEAKQVIQLVLTIEEQSNAEDLELGLAVWRFYRGLEFNMPRGESKELLFNALGKDIARDSTHPANIFHYHLEKLVKIFPLKEKKSDDGLKKISKAFQKLKSQGKLPGKKVDGGLPSVVSGVPKVSEAPVVPAVRGVEKDDQQRRSPFGMGAS